MRAQPALPFDVQWSAPAGCPGRDVLLRALQRRLPAGRPPEDLHVRARVTRQGASFQLTLELKSPLGDARRNLVNAQCEPLVEAAAVLVMLAIEPESAAAREPGVASEPGSPAAPADEPAGPAPSRGPEPTEPSPASEPLGGPAAPNTSGTTPAMANSTAEPDSEPEPEPESAPDLPASAPAGTSSQLVLQLSAAARGSTGMLPGSPTLGVQAQLALRWGRAYAAAGLSYWPAREQRSSAYPDAWLRGSALLSDVSLGADAVTGWVRLTPSLDLEVGQIAASARGIAGPEPARTLWITAGAGATLSVQLRDRWDLGLELAGLVPLFRTRWLVRLPQSQVSAFVASPVGLRISLRIGYVFR